MSMNKTLESRLSRLNHGMDKKVKTKGELEVVEPRAARAAVAPAGRAGATPTAKRPAKTVPSPTPAPVPAGKAGRFGTVRTSSVGLSLGAKSLPTRGIDAWSYSRLTDWELCPLKAKLKHVDRMKEPGSAAMERGSLIHKLAEDYANGAVKKLPPELLKFEKEFALLKKLNPTCEEQWAFTREWGFTGWFDGPWLRVKIDAFCTDKKVETMRVIDHKTGKVKEDHEDQLSLYATASFSKYPSLQTVTSELWYLDDGQKKELDFTRDQLPELKEFWEGRVRPMFEDRRFPANPNRLCQWCFFRKSNGGPCKF